MNVAKNIFDRCCVLSAEEKRLFSVEMKVIGGSFSPSTTIKT